MIVRTISVLVAATLLSVPLQSQTRIAAGTVGGGGISVGMRGAPGFRGTIPAGLQHSRRGDGFGRNTIFFPYYPFYSDYGYEVEEAPPAKPVTVSAPPQTPPAPPIEPLLIEWQGDRFVRMTLSQKAPQDTPSGPDYAERTVSPRRASAGRKAAPPAPREQPPAVLVFRDGRREEISSYTIMSGAIYSKADYWSSGSWTKKIQIAELDVPATLKLNQERGVKFALPAGPNEVVMRP